MSPVSDSAVQFNFTAYGYKDKNEISYKMCISISQKFKKIGVESNDDSFTSLIWCIKFNLNWNSDSIRISESNSNFSHLDLERYIPGGL